MREDTKKLINLWNARREVRAFLAREADPYRVARRLNSDRLQRARMERQFRAVIKPHPYGLRVVRG